MDEQSASLFCQTKYCVLLFDCKLICSVHCLAYFKYLSFHGEEIFRWHKFFLKDVTKRFGNVTAVDNISLDIKDREFIVLVGPSGCG